MAEKTTMHTTIQVRRGTTAEWEAVKTTCVPAAGEPCLNTDTGFVVYGDGKSTYEQLVIKTEKANSLAILISEAGGLEKSEDGKLKLKGVDEAPANSTMFSDGQGNVTWKETYTKEEVDEKVTSVFKYKGKVDTKSELENKKADASNGDTYYVTDEDEFYVYDGTNFESFGSGSVYATKEDLQALKKELEGDEGKMIEQIKVAGKVLHIEEKSVDIPIASGEDAGVVKTSEKENSVAVQEDGTMEVNKLNVIKLVQTIGDTLIIDGGEADDAKV